MKRIYNYMLLHPEETKKRLIYSAFAIIILVWHIDLGYISDDAVVAPTVSDNSLWERFCHLWSTNGRIFTDTFANLFYRLPMPIWKCFDTAVYLLIAFLLVEMFTKKTYKDVLAVCLLVLLFPFNYMESAGYIATSTNYLYPMACVLIVACTLYHIQKGQSISWVRWVVTIVSLLYATNHDQYAVVLIGGLFMFLLYNIKYKAPKKLIKYNTILLLVTSALYTFTCFLPGHIARTNSTAERDYWFPEYATWSFADKIYRGYTSTVANVIFYNVALFVVFTALLFFVALKSNKIINCIVGAIPLVITVAVRCTVVLSGLGQNRFIFFDVRTCGLPDLLSVQTTALPVVLSILVVIFIFVAIWLCVENFQRKCMLTMLLILAAGSREMMGFSATIFASSFRTFTFFLFSLIASSLILLRELYKEENDSKCKNDVQ